MKMFTDVKSKIKAFYYSGYHSTDEFRCKLFILAMRDVEVLNTFLAFYKDKEYPIYDVDKYVEVMVKCFPDATRKCILALFDSKFKDAFSFVREVLLMVTLLMMACSSGFVLAIGILLPKWPHAIGAIVGMLSCIAIISLPHYKPLQKKLLLRWFKKQKFDDMGINQALMPVKKRLTICKSAFN